MSKLILTLALFLTSINLYAGAYKDRYAPRNPDSDARLIPAPAVQSVSCDCVPSPWVGEFYISQCDVRTHTWGGGADFRQSHIQLSLRYFQKYFFNGDKLKDHYANKNYNSHVFDPQANTFGLYAGIELYSRFGAVSVSDHATGATAAEATGSHADIHFGISYQFRLVDSVLHNLDLGLYYSVGFSNYNMDQSRDSVSASNILGIYAGWPTYFAITDHFALGVHLALKYDLQDRFNVATLNTDPFIDLYFGLNGRYQF